MAYCGVLTCWQVGSCNVHDRAQRLFITSYTLPIPGHVKGEAGPGVSACKWFENGTRIEVCSTDEKANPSPSALFLRPDGNTLFVASENGGSDPNEPMKGKVSSFAVGETLSFINQQPANGNATCFLSGRRDGHTIYAANYNLGSVSSFTVAEDGALSQATTIDHRQFWQADMVANKARQADGAHAHCAVLDPSQKYLFACDLGCDLIVQYRVQESGQLEVNNPPFVRCPPNSGPRHLFFHPRLPVCYVSNELNCTLGVYQFDPLSGTLTAIQMVPTLHTTSGVSTYSTSHVEVHPSGQFVVIGNRSHGNIGDDSLALFPIDQASGHVRSPMFGQAPGGSVIRHFSFDPSGTHVLVAYQDSGHIGVFSIAPSSFTLKCVNMIKWNGSPNFILFGPAR